MGQKFRFRSEQFEKIFPFYIHIDGDLQIRNLGISLMKLVNPGSDRTFLNHFELNRPRLEIKNAVDLRSICDQLVILAFISNPKLTLRGQFEATEEGCFLFVGSPWFHSMEDVVANGLGIKDFAPHDPMVDLLHVLKNQEIATQEVKELLSTVNRQRKELKESERNYRVIVENASDIIYKCDLSGRFTFVNEVAQKRTEYSRGELLRMHYSDLIRDDKKLEVRQFYQKQVTDRVTTTYCEFPISTKSGNEIWIGQSVQFPLSSGGEPQLTALALDITERKIAEQRLARQEERYRNIIENMNLGLLEVDNADIIQYANLSFCAMSGYTLEELQGKKAASLLAEPESERIILSKNEQRLKGNSDMYLVEARNKLGEKRWWMISGAPRYNDRGEMVGSIGIHLDITTQKLLEDELKEARIKAEDSVKAKESFLATMSHELRTPLNAIVGIANLMRIEPESRNDENVDLLSFSAENLLALISDILDFSKIEAGKVELSKDEIALRTLFDSIYRSFTPACEEKGIALYMNIDDSIPGLVIGDELRLYQIMNNLVSNAVKFTRKGSVDISVHSTHLDSDRVDLRITVRDTGIGIAPEDQDKVFNKFEQVNRSRSEFGGTGLGLNITRKLVELQDGEIRMNSEPGFGTTFHVQFSYPLVKTNPTGKTVLQGEFATPQYSTTGLRILVAEDNPINQKVARSFLSHWEIESTFANNGLQALELLEEEQFDLVLMDLFMPEMDGFEAIQRIRSDARFRGLPIIALTASAETSIIERALRLGADSCLSKPFNPDQLRDTIARYAADSFISDYSRSNMELSSKYAHIDLGQLEAASLGSADFMLNMVQLIQDEVDASIARCSSFLEESDAGSFAREIHKMKNSLLTAGIYELREVLSKLEKSGDSPEYNEMRNDLNLIRNIWHAAKIELNEAAVRLKRDPEA